ncbi:MAG: helix-turn-helix transcriptional regulator [Lachnospiraceae bacterium]|nr:helix-turn-helix transcriptional regulator [Lachnospiraceae bacterium]MEE1086893.1 helix-turn-helix transcriptional regulator [Schaedlerella sp.]
MTLGEKLSKLRKEYNYTQEQLADILGVSRQSISKWESDIAYPETEKLIELGKIFECSMDYLLKDEVAEKTGDSVSESYFTEKVTEISKKVLTDKNKGKAKKILKIIGIILAVFLVVDIISMILYFCVLGTPH